MFRPMETHFFNRAVDSVEAAWPEVRDFCLEHEARRDLDSAAYYNRLDCDTLMNASVQHRYRSQLANALKHYDEALTEADSAMADASAMGYAMNVGNLEQRAIALEGLGRYSEALADVRQIKSLNDSIPTPSARVVADRPSCSSSTATVWHVPRSC